MSKSAVIRIQELTAEAFFSLLNVEETLLRRPVMKQKRGRVVFLSLFFLYVAMFITLPSLFDIFLLIHFYVGT